MVMRLRVYEVCVEDRKGEDIDGLDKTSELFRAIQGLY